MAQTNTDIYIQEDSKSIPSSESEGVDWEELAEKIRGGTVGGLGKYALGVFLNNEVCVWSAGRSIISSCGVRPRVCGYERINPRPYNAYLHTNRPPTRRARSG